MGVDAMSVSVAMGLAVVLNAAASEAVWDVGPVVLTPGPAGAFDAVAVKDPSVVRYDGHWHVFYTACGRDGYSLGYVAAETFEELDAAPRTALKQLAGGVDGYAAAPQVFYFAPAKTWYLIYQTRDSNYLPVYATTKNIADPASWTPPQSLVAKEEKAKWIDFWVICDEASAYLFYTRDHRDVYVMDTPLAEFPAGFGRPRAVFGPVHEAVHIYKAQGTDTYHMLYELRREDGQRSFGLAVAEALGGPWKKATDDYATADQLVYPEGATRWTEEVSHGELLRAGYDERLIYDPAEVRFLVQGLAAGEHEGAYHRLPWCLGVIVRR